MIRKGERGSSRGGVECVWLFVLSNLMVFFYLYNDEREKDGGINMDGRKEGDDKEGCITTTGT